MSILDRLGSVERNSLYSVSWGRNRKKEHTSRFFVPKFQYKSVFNFSLSRLLRVLEVGQVSSPWGISFQMRSMISLNRLGSDIKDSLYSTLQSRYGETDKSNRLVVPTLQYNSAVFFDC